MRLSDERIMSSDPSILSKPYTTWCKTTNNNKKQQHDITKSFIQKMLVNVTSLICYELVSYLGFFQASTVSGGLYAFLLLSSIVLSCIAYHSTT